MAPAMKDWPTNVSVLKPAGIWSRFVVSSTEPARAWAEMPSRHTTRMVRAIARGIVHGISPLARVSSESRGAESTPFGAAFLSGVDRRRLSQTRSKLFLRAGEIAAESTSRAARSSRISARPASGYWEDRVPSD